MNAPKNPSETDTPSIVFVHGFRPGDGQIPTAVKGSGEGFNCYKNYWSDAIEFLRERGLGDFRTIQYYNGDTNCTNGEETRYSSNLHQDLYRRNCTDYHAGKKGTQWEGTNDESLYHLSCLFAQYLHHNFGQSNNDVILVAHSMGGIIVRETMYQMQEHAGQSPFPDTIGRVTKAITFNTPHGGVPDGAHFFACGGCTQVEELGTKNVFMSELSKYGLNPQPDLLTKGLTTEWTVTGSECDLLVRPPSAIGMHARHAVVYPLGSNTCYGHGEALNDKIVDQDSIQYACDTGNPDGYPCVPSHRNLGRKMDGNWRYVNNGLRGLSQLYYSITGRLPEGTRMAGKLPSGVERIGSNGRLSLLSTAITAWTILRR
jgi:pimeloyl-ACP methyl ester carboxylesterase